MQKTFKRTLSLVLAVLMVTALFTALPITASAAEDEIAVGDTKEISVNGGIYTYLKFVPDKDMVISFYSSSSRDTYGIICDAEKTLLVSNDDSGEGNNFMVTYPVTAGTTYYLGARFYSNSFNETVNVTLSGEEFGTIAVGDTKSVTSQGTNDGDYKYFKFTPEEEMFISFYSTGNIDTIGRIYNFNGFRFLSSDYDSGENNNFKIEYKVYADQTYLLAAAGNGTFDIVLREAEAPAFTETPEIIGTSVTLDDFIRLNVYVDTKGTSCGYTIRDLDTEFWYEGDHRMQGLSDGYGEYEVTELANDIEKVSIKVFAKEMADRFEIDLTALGSGIDTKVTSVKEYLETIIKSPEAYAPEGKAAELKNLCCATLNYGYAAQVQFDHIGAKTITNQEYEGAEESIIQTEDIPAANQYLTNHPEIGYTPTENIVVGLDEGSKADFSDFGLEYYASSLGLFDNTSYAICFEKTEYKDYSVYINDEYQDSNRVGQAQVTTTDEEGNTTTVSHYMIAYYISGIAAKDILNDFDVTFVGYDDDRNQITRTFKFSPKTYIYKVINNSGVTPNGYTDESTYTSGLTYNTSEVQKKDNLARTVAAIYDYSTRAAEYFNAIEG